LQFHGKEGKFEKACTRVITADKKSNSLIELRERIKKIATVMQQEAKTKVRKSAYYEKLSNYN
jgi:hypothetical protein